MILATNGLQHNTSPRCAASDAPRIMSPTIGAGPFGVLIRALSPPEWGSADCKHHAKLKKIFGLQSSIRQEVRLSEEIPLDIFIEKLVAHVP